MTYTPKHLKRWTLAAHYYGRTWEDFYAAPVGLNRDSDALTRANFDVALEALEGTEAQRVAEAHWACGWVAWIAIPETDAEGLRIADEMAEQLEDYPVLDDDRFAEYEQADADETWASIYSPSERIKYIRGNRNQFEFQSLADMLGCVRGKYFAGNASELICR